MIQIMAVPIPYSSHHHRRRSNATRWLLILYQIVFYHIADIIHGTSFELAVEVQYYGINNDGLTVNQLNQSKHHNKIIHSESLTINHQQ
jgi:hypothetical protein